MKKIRMYLLVLLAALFIHANQANAYSLSLQLVDYSIESWVLLANSSDVHDYVDDVSYDNGEYAMVYINEDNWAKGRVKMGEQMCQSSASAYYTHDLDYATTSDYRLFKNLYSRGRWELTLLPEPGETGGRDFNITYDEVGSPDRLWHLYDPLAPGDIFDEALWLEAGPGPSYQPDTVYLEYGVTYYIDSAYGLEGSSSLTFTDTGTPAPIPEPTTIILFGIGISGFACYRKGRGKATTDNLVHGSGC